MLPLAACSISSLVAIQSGLFGPVPSLDPMPPVKLNGQYQFALVPPIARSLEVLELSKNNISQIRIPKSSHVLTVRKNQGLLQFGPNVLRDILEDKRRWSDFRITRFDTSEFRRLLGEGKLKKTATRSFQGPNASFRCYDLKTVSFEITPPLIMPEWCQCMPGWYGKATHCVPCPKGRFSQNHDEPTCSRCPMNSTTLTAGAKSRQDCKCDGGVPMVYLHEKITCGCPPRYAEYEGQCWNCAEQHFDCPRGNMQLALASPEEGFARIDGSPKFAIKVFQCLAPATKRCRAEAASELGCAAGYTGPLCMDCMDGFHSSGGVCKACSKDVVQSAVVHVVVATLILGSCLGMAFAFVMWNASLRQQLGQFVVQLQAFCFAQGYLGNVQQALMKAELPMLLQQSQLWGVLAVLSRARAAAGSGIPWEIPYVQSLQFAMTSLADFAFLQCYFGGSQTRWLLALASPMLPLTIFFGCFGLEYQQHGLGINAALRVLTMLFIGGAYKCSALSICQHVDANGEKLHQFAFLRNLPQVYCKDQGPEARKVQAIFWLGFFGYAILIPLFLAYLYARQHHVLRHERMPLQSSMKDASTTILVFKDLVLARRLVATAVAYTSSCVSDMKPLALPSGGCSIQLRVLLSDQSATLISQGSQGDMHGMPNVNLGVADAQFAMTEMLMEHCILEEKAADRFLMGMKEMLWKYSLCRNVWMEIALKVVSVMLVQVVSNAQARPIPTT